MSVSAAVQFTQGASVGTPGQSLFGVTGSLVNVGNGNNTNVTGWTFNVIDVPRGSAVPTGTVQGPGPASVWPFVPDVTGGYYLQISVTDGQGNTAVDARSFGVKRASGRYIPAFSSPATGNNFAGQGRGWSPSLEDWLIYLDGIAALPAFNNSNIGQVLGVVTSGLSSTLAWVPALPAFNNSNLGQSLTVLAGPTLGWAQNGPFGIGNGGAVVTTTYTMQPTDFNLLIAAGAQVTMPAAPIRGATYRMTRASGVFSTSQPMTRVFGNSYVVYAPDGTVDYENGSSVVLKGSLPSYAWWWTGSAMVLA